jgi:O-antigen/teichoic acid export membrane protein
VKSPLQALTKETAVYGFSTVAGRFLNFLLTPFYVNVLRSSTEYGIAGSLYAYLAFFSVILPLGLEGAYFRYAARAEEKAPERDSERRLFSTPFWTICAVGAPIAILAILFSPRLAPAIFSDSRHDLSAFGPSLAAILRDGAVILFLDALAVIPFAALRLERRAWLFASIRTGGIVLTLALNFLFVLHYRWGIVGIFHANVIASAAILVAVLWSTREKLSGVFEASVFRTMAPFGLASVPAYLAAMMVQVIDRPIVQKLKGLDALGVYQANYRMGFAMMVLVSVFDYAWRPFFLREYATRGEAVKPLFARVFTYTTLVLLGAFLVLAFFLPWFVGVPLPGIHHSLLRKDYLSGTGVIPVVLLAYVFQAFYTNFIAGIYIAEKTRWLPAVTGLGAAVNIAANLLLIPAMGILGAAYATLAAYAAMAAAIYVCAGRFFPIRYEWGRVTAAFAVVLPAYALGSWSGSHWLQAVLAPAAAAVLWVGGFFSPDEKTALARLVGIKGYKS